MLELVNQNKGWSVRVPDHLHMPSKSVLTKSPEPRAFRGVTVRLARVAAFASVVTLMAVGAAHAAGLGRLTVQSALGEPLRAEIEVNSVSKEETASLTARVAPASEFARANMDYAPAL